MSNAPCQDFSSNVQFHFGLNVFVFIKPTDAGLHPWYLLRTALIHNIIIIGARPQLSIFSDARWTFIGMHGAALFGSLGVFRTTIFMVSANRSCCTLSGAWWSYKKKKEREQQISIQREKQRNERGKWKGMKYLTKSWRTKTKQQIWMEGRERVKKPWDKMKETKRRERDICEFQRQVQKQRDRNLEAEVENERHLKDSFDFLKLILILYSL